MSSDRTAPVLLQTRGLTLQAGTRTLISGLDWQVNAGEFWCILGRNGVGKSTLLHTLAGLHPADGGDVALFDAERGQASPLSTFNPQHLARTRALMQQQQFDAFSSSIFDTVAAGRFPHGAGWFGIESDAEELRRRAAGCLTQVGMKGREQEDVTRLSGGERQRVALATLLMQDVPLCLLDEPTSHQDIAAQLELMGLLRSQAGAGKAVVASCHDVNLACRFATHVLLLGGQVRQGEVAQVMHAEALGDAFACRFRWVEIDGAEVFVPDAL